MSTMMYSLARSHAPSDSTDEPSWTSDLHQNSPSGDQPRYDGMEPEGLIDSNWKEVYENFDDMALRLLLVPII